MATVNWPFPTRQVNMSAKTFPVKYTKFSLGDIKQAANKLKKKKSAGPDGLFSEALIAAVNKFPEKINDMLNQCLENQ